MLDGHPSPPDEYVLHLAALAGLGGDDVVLFRLPSKTAVSCRY